ncbi:MAG: biotin-dependent carboxyltransferase family protein [Pseudomonadota bacterium]
MRGLGIPGAGPADAVAMAFANTLVQNDLYNAAIEVTQGGFECIFDRSVAIGLSGGAGRVALNGKSVGRDRTIIVHEEDHLVIDPLTDGMRTYLAVHSGFALPQVFGSESTYLPSSFGGLDGRALEAEDRLLSRSDHNSLPIVQTPEDLIDPYDSTIILRVTPSVEWEALTSEGKRALFGLSFRVASQIDRMGIRLKGDRMEMTPGTGNMQSSAVFPGTVQCPEGGRPIILGPDAQTTGGYPRIASVIACDLPRLGQLRPGTKIQFVHRSIDQAAADNSGWVRRLGTWIEADRLV